MSIPKLDSPNYRVDSVSYEATCYGASDHSKSDIFDDFDKYLKRNGVYRYINSMNFDWNKMTQDEKKNIIDELCGRINAATLGVSGGNNALFQFQNRTINPVARRHAINEAIFMPQRNPQAPPIDTNYKIGDPSFVLFAFTHRYITEIARETAERQLEEIWSRVCNASAPKGLATAQMRMTKEHMRRNPDIYRDPRTIMTNILRVIQHHVGSIENQLRASNELDSSPFKWPGRYY